MQPSKQHKKSFRARSLADLWRRVKKHPLAKMGPGLITGAADDDPSGIATYSQAGAQFGLDMLWTMPLAYPLMSAIQSLCVQIGRVTGRGLAANIKAADYQSKKRRPKSNYDQTRTRHLDCNRRW